MKVVVIVSGGLDSAVLLHDLRRQGHELKALSVYYGQRHARELACAERLCAALGVEHRLADLQGLASLLAGNSLTSRDVPVPEGHYAEDTMKATVVPNRNMILLSVAAGWAIALKYDAVAYAAHGGDHAIYPDCRPAFTDALDRAIQLADWHPVRLLSPYTGLAKADLVRRGAALGVPFAETWSCYQGGDIHCGRCGTCVERREAFQLAGVPDPTTYACTGPLPERPGQQENG